MGDPARGGPGRAGLKRGAQEEVLSTGYKEGGKEILGTCEVSQEARESQDGSLNQLWRGRNLRRPAGGAGEEVVLQKARLCVHFRYI